ncbi:MAG: Ppx/GppA family phosphatase, partial [Holophagales bacterium]|nr:Ppx/GppA family phosphatase [Holophagales bacterium]
MVIARKVGEGIQLVDRLREGVRLAAYLDLDRRITVAGQERALACLRKFGQRIRDFPRGNVRAVGTNTLRKARNRDQFLKEAQKALGHPIDVVSGREEARLIFLGAAHSLAGNPSKRLVLDIGGGSTEVVLGQGLEPRMVESLYMGCVSYTLAHFSGGKISARRMRKAETAARLELRSMKAPYRKAGWELAVGASGTVNAVAEILRLQGWSERGITPEGLERLRQELLLQGHVDDLSLAGLRRERARVLPGGLAILTAVFDSLKIDRMLVSPGAMREGVLYDLLGRLRHEDTRDHTIQLHVDQFNVDEEQASRVEQTALLLLAQAEKRWKLDPERSRAFLRWAARLHEIGLAVAHGGCHKHGAYLLQHSDLPGFSFQDQRILALLVRGQRRKLP